MPTATHKVLALRFVAGCIAAVLTVMGAERACAGVANVADLPLWTPNNTVYATKVDEANKLLYIGGAFTKLSPYSGNGGVFKTADGTVAMDTPIVEQAHWGTISYLNAVVSDGSGGWFIGGNFQRVGGVERQNLAHIKADGTVDLNWNPGAAMIPGDGLQSQVQDLAYDAANNFLYASGAGMVLARNPNGSVKVYGFGRMNATSGVVDETFLQGSPNFGVSGCLTLADGKLYAAVYPWPNPPRLAVMDLATSVFDTTTWPVLDQNGGINDITVNGNHVYVGGTFSSIGGVSRSCLAHIDNSTGTPTVDATFPEVTYPGVAPGNGLPNLRCIQVIGAKVFIGGQFTEVVTQAGTVAIGDFVAIDTAGFGTVDAGFPTVDPKMCPYHFAVSGNTLYLSGNFLAVGGLKRTGIAAINVLTKAVSTTFNPELGDLNPHVSAIAVDGANLFAGGQFTHAGGVTRNGLAAIDIDPLSVNFGKATNWNPNWILTPSASNRILAIEILDNNLYAGGSFLYSPTVGAPLRSNLACIGKNTGVTEPAFPSAGGPSGGIVRALASFGNILYVGGRFDLVQGQSRQSIAAIDMTTQGATNWYPGALTASATEGIHALALDATGSTLYAGGKFTAVGATAINNAFAASTSGTGSVLAGWNPDPDNIVRALVANGATTYIGGDFNSLAAGIAGISWFSAIDSDPLSAAYGMPMNSSMGWQGWSSKVLALHVDSNGSQLLVGGDINTSSSRDHAAALALNSGTLKGWTTSIDGIPFGSTAPVNTISASANYVFLGGAMQLVDGSTRHWGLAGYHRSAEILSSALLPAARSGQAYSATIEADGLGTITWSLVGAPGWLSINAAGQLSGNPQAVDGNKTYTFDVAIDTTGNVSPHDLHSKTFTLFVEGSAFALPFSTGFEATDPIPSRLDAGVFARAGIVTTAASANSGGAQGLQLDTVPGLANWPLQGGANPAGQNSADNPALWSVDAPTHTGMLGGVLTVSNVSALRVTFDWQAVRGLRDWYTNLVFEVNDGSGWRLGFKNGEANGQGIYRPGAVTTSWAATSFYVTGLNTAATSVEFRFRWLCKFNVDNAIAGFGTGLNIDNLLIEDATGILFITAPISLSNAIEGAAYGPVLVGATGGTPAYNWTVTGLPLGMTFNPATGAIEGAPNVGTAGSYNVVISVSDAGNPVQNDQITLPLTVVIPNALVITAPVSLPDATEVIAYGPVLVGATGGTLPYTWAVTGLPASLTFNAATGAIEGTPDAGTAGNYNITITVTDTSAPIQNAQVILPLVVSAAGSLSITTSALPNARERATYGPVTLAVSGGTGPYVWALNAGTLPAGMILAGDGRLMGTPARGTSRLLPYTFTVEVTDSLGAVDTQSLSLVVDPPVVKPLRFGGGCSLERSGSSSALWVLAGFGLVVAVSMRRTSRPNTAR